MNVNVCGVGGQGVLFASAALARAFLLEGRPVLCAESHGMAQRGGSLLTHVRTDADAASPIVPTGACELMLSLELAEPLRHAALLSPRTRVVASAVRVVPVAVSLGSARYPPREEVLASLRRCAGRVDVLDLAGTAVPPQAANVAALGFVSASLPLEEGSLRAGVEAESPERHVERNLAAFAAGAMMARGAADA